MLVIQRFIDDVLAPISKNSKRPGRKMTCRLICIGNAIEAQQHMINLTIELLVHTARRQLANLVFAGK